MQQVMPDHAGSKRWDSLMRYLGPDTTVKNSDGAPWTSDDSRNTVCDTTWSVHKTDASVGSVDCDEYAMASTHESGSYPKSVNKVTSGSKCAQLFTDKTGDGSANFGLLADTRTATNGPTGTERCGAGEQASPSNRTARRSAVSRPRRGGCWTVTGSSSPCRDMSTARQPRTPAHGARSADLKVCFGSSCSLCMWEVVLGVRALAARAAGHQQLRLSSTAAAARCP